MTTASFTALSRAPCWEAVTVRLPVDAEDTLVPNIVFEEILDDADAEDEDDVEPMDVDQSELSESEDEDENMEVDNL